MRHWLRSHLTYANVMVSVLAFVVLGGGTALASFVVSSNSQIGPNTVSGHKPPSGDHSNIITGSVNGTDLATGSVSAAKLGTNSVGSSNVINGSLLGGDIHANTITGSNLNLSSVADSLKIRTAYDQATPTATPPGHTLFTKGPWTLTDFCVDMGMGQSSAGIQLTASGFPALLSIDNSSGTRIASGSPQFLAATPNSSATQVRGADFSAAAVGFVNQLSGRVNVGVDYDDGSPSCVFTFQGLGQ